MNRNKPIAAIFATVLFATTLASAQTVNVTPGTNADGLNYNGALSITFSVEINPKVELTVTQYPSNITGGNFAKTSTGADVVQADFKLAAVIDVEVTGVSLWDVTFTPTLTAANRGKLKNKAGSDYLKGSNGTSTADAVLRILACRPTSAGPSVEDGGTTCLLPNITSGFVINGTTVNTSLATALAKPAGFQASDLNGSNKTHFAIYATLPYSKENLSGKGEYEENFTVAFISKY